MSGESETPIPRIDETFAAAMARERARLERLLWLTYPLPSATGLSLVRCPLCAAAVVDLDYRTHVAWHLRCLQ